VATFSAVQRSHILQAIEECDRRGGEDFLGVYGFAPSVGYVLTHEDRTYDSKAILGVAHRYATGRLATSEEFGDGMGAAAELLRKRGFEVSEPAVAARPARSVRPRAATPRQAPVRRVAVPDRPVAMCPTCFIALPATGICDQCG
jgi:hypothetical protein